MVRDRVVDMESFESCWSGPLMWFNPASAVNGGEASLLRMKLKSSKQPDCGEGCLPMGNLWKVGVDAFEGKHGSSGVHRREPQNGGKRIVIVCML